ncbi:hypothetical protein RYX36_033271 [Vicia faba]
MFSILANVSESNSSLLHATQSHLSEYSSQGLRTLVVASRSLYDAELEEWQSRYGEASTALTDRATKLRQTATLIECNLNLLGATGIEDKLQEGVPEAIESLRQAGIKFWVLTGDKQETAISIGLSCKLLSANMQQIVINDTSEEECRNLLGDAIAKYTDRDKFCSRCFPSGSNISTIKELAHSLTSHCPYQVPIASLKIRHVHREVPSSEIFYSLNASIVGLAVESEGPENSPWCLGLGIVRGIDTVKAQLRTKQVPPRLPADKAIEQYLTSTNRLLILGFNGTLTEPVERKG